MHPNSHHDSAGAPDALLAALAAQGAAHASFAARAQAYLDAAVTDYTDFAGSAHKATHAFLAHFPPPDFVRPSFAAFERDFAAAEEAFRRDAALAAQAARATSPRKGSGVGPSSARGSALSLSNLPSGGLTRRVADLAAVARALQAVAAGGGEAMAAADLLDRLSDALMECARVLRPRVTVVGRLHARMADFMRARDALAVATAVLTPRLRAESDAVRAALARFLAHVQAGAARAERSAPLEPRFAALVDDRFNHFFHREVLPLLLRYKALAARAVVGPLLTGDALALRVARTPLAAMKLQARAPAVLLVHLLAAAAAAAGALHPSPALAARVDAMRTRCAVLALPPLVPLYEMLAEAPAPPGGPPPGVPERLFTLTAAAVEGERVDFGALRAALALLRAAARDPRAADALREPCELLLRLLRKDFLFDAATVRCVVRGHFAPERALLRSAAAAQSRTAHLIDAKNSVASLARSAAEFCARAPRFGQLAEPLARFCRLANGCLTSTRVARDRAAPRPTAAGTPRGCRAGRRVPRDARRRARDDAAAARARAGGRAGQSRADTRAARVSADVG